MDTYNIKEKFEIDDKTRVKKLLVFANVSENDFNVENLLKDPIILSFVEKVEQIQKSLSILTGFRETSINAKEIKRELTQKRNELKEEVKNYLQNINKSELEIELDKLYNDSDCPFCKEVYSRHLAELYYKKRNYTYTINVALVNNTIYQGEKTGHTTHYGFALKYCPVCGKIIENFENEINKEI